MSAMACREDDKKPDSDYRNIREKVVDVSAKRKEVVYQFSIAVLIIFLTAVITAWAQNDKYVTKTEFEKLSEKIENINTWVNQQKGKQEQIERFNRIKE